MQLLSQCEQNVSKNITILGSEGSSGRERHEEDVLVSLPPQNIQMISGTAGRARVSPLIGPSTFPKFWS